MIPKLIHIFWDEEDIPEKLKLFINNIKRNNKDFKVKIYSSKDLPFDLQNVIPQFKSDVFRLYALYMYGGIYIDISSVFFDNIKKAVDLSDDRVQGYSIPMGDDIPYDKITDFTLENWLLACGKKNPFIYKWLLNVLIAYNIGYNEYIYLHRNLMNDYFKTRLPYLMEHFAYHVTCEDLGIPVNKNNKYIKLIGISHEPKNPFYIQHLFKWKRYKMINVLLNTHYVKGIGIFIKFTE